MGIVVDTVHAVMEIPTTEIEPPPSFGAKIRSDFIQGIAKVGGKFVIVLNVQQVLSAEEIGSMGRAGARVDGSTLADVAERTGRTLGAAQEELLAA